MTTITTVGYGDFNASSSSEEMLFVMVLEIVGLVVFTFVMGAFLSLGTSKSL